MISKNRAFINLSELLAIFGRKGGGAEFERAFAERVGARYGLVFPYCRSAITALLRAMAHSFLDTWQEVGVGQPTPS